YGFRFEYDDEKFSIFEPGVILRTKNYIVGFRKSGDPYSDVLYVSIQQYSEIVDETDTFIEEVRKIHVGVMVEKTINNTPMKVVKIFEHKRDLYEELAIFSAYTIKDGEPGEHYKYFNLKDNLLITIRIGGPSNIDRYES